MENLCEESSHITEYSKKKRAQFTNLLTDTKNFEMKVLKVDKRLMKNEHCKPKR